jgi:hypothetical protein
MAVMAVRPPKAAVEVARDQMTTQGRVPPIADRQGSAMKGHSSVVSPGHSDGGSARSNGHSTAGGERCFVEHHSGEPSLPTIGRC